MVLKLAPKVLNGPCGQIGSPDEYFKNKARNYFPEYDCKIPMQRDSLDDDDLDADQIDHLLFSTNRSPALLDKSITGFS